MSATLTLYTHPMSRGRIVRWMLEEVGAPYKTVVLDFGREMAAPAYRKLNPMGKVPTLCHGETVITECAAICAYLADAFPEAGLAPAPGERGAYYRWLFFGAGPLEAAVTNHALGVTVKPDQRGFVGYGSFDAVMTTLQSAVTASPFIAGDRFTAADVYVGSQIGWGLEFGTLAERPAFRAYWSRIEDRPARKRAQALDDAAIPAQA